MRVVTLCALAVSLSAGVPAGFGADWSRIGADAGLSKYSPDDIPAASVLELQYVKRFYGKYAPDRGNFFYGSSVVTHGGKAIIVADDRQDSPASDRVSLLQFDWSTGQTEAYYDTPFPFSENTREVDSHHYTNSIIWHSDGRVYIRRGGDNSAIRVFLPDTGEQVPLYYRDGQGNVLSRGIDANAFMQAWQDKLIYRYGNTFATSDYWAVSISEDCFVAPNQTGPADMLGRWTADVGPSVPNVAGPDGLYGSTGRYGDIPKCANGICVLAGLVYSSLETYPNNTKVCLEATDLVSGKTLWMKAWTSDSGGQQGLGTSISDYWRFIATDSGHYIFFTRAAQDPVAVRAVDLCTGQEVWSKDLADPAERPLLAYHAGYVYVIGRADQYKLDVKTGSEVWHTTYSWPNDRGYVLGNHDLGSVGAYSQDPLYRPVVLTDSTLWFVDGDLMNNSSTPTAATLVAIRTSDGQVAQQMDLRGLYSTSAGESLLVVNDLLVADRMLGVLVGVKNAASAYPSTNGMDYQDLFVFKAIKVGDINRDGAVNIADLRLLVAAWGAAVGDAKYDPAADLDHSNSISLGDLKLLVTAWGK